jgi:hypothetical protein
VESSNDRKKCRSMEDRVNDLVGLNFVHKNKSYGTIISIEQIDDSSSVRYIALTDTNRQIDAFSIIRAISFERMNNRKDENGNATGIAYPDGTAYNAQINTPKGVYSGGAVGVAQIQDLGDGYIHNCIKVGKEVVRINRKED